VRALVLLTLSACHVFSDGTIDVTCDDLPACSGTDTATVDTADTGAPGLTLGAGVGYAATDGERWTLAAVDSDLAVTFQRSGLGDFSGPLDYNPETGQATVATTDRLYVFGPDSDDIQSFLMPTAGAPAGLARASFGTIVVTDAEIVYQAATTAEPVQVAKTAAFVGNFMSAFSSAAGDLVYVVSTHDGTGALYSLQPDTGIAVVAEDLGVLASRDLGGGGFSGDGGALSFCSVDGTVYEMATSSTGGVDAVAQAEAATDVIRCAWDSDTQQHLMLQADGTLLTVSDSGTTRTALLRDGLVATHGLFFD